MAQISSFNAHAEQKIVAGDFQVHYSVFPSNVISPKIAANYQIKRSKNRALVNVTPQSIKNGGSKGVSAMVSGKARNLIGNTKTLVFREFIEGDVVYYLAEFSFSHLEHFRFDIDVQPSTPGAKPIKVKFEKKFINP